MFDGDDDFPIKQTMHCGSKRTENRRKQYKDTSSINRESAMNPDYIEFYIIPVQMHCILLKMRCMGN